MRCVTDDRRFVFAAAVILLLPMTAGAFSAAIVDGKVAPQTDEGALKQAVVTLYDQLSPVANGANSQDYVSGFTQYNSEAADDFTVPAGLTWLVGSVAVSGLYRDPPGTVDLASDVNLVFLNDAAGLPGGVAASYSVASGLVVNDDGSGNLALDLPAPLSLPAGTYWLSVQAVLQPNPQDQWFWLAHGGPSAGAVAVWRNPPGGFGLGCTAWGPISTCLPIPETDLSFRLEGEVGAADLEIAKSGPATVTVPLGGPAQAVPFTITVTNNGGPYPAKDVVVTDVIDPEMTYNGDSCGAGAPIAGVWTWTVAPLLGVGASASCTLTLNAETFTSQGSHPNTAAVGGDPSQPDPDTADRSDSAPLAVTNPNPSIDINVSKVAAGPTIVPGQVFDFTIIATNPDTSQANGVRASDVLDRRLTYVSDSCSAGAPVSGTWSWNVGTLAPTGGSASCTLTVQAAPDAAGTIDNTARVISDNPDPVMSDNSSTASVDVEEADVRVTKSASPVAALLPGESFSYTVTAFNDGPHSAGGVLVTDTLDARLTWMSDTCGAGAPLAGVWTWDLATLPASAAASCSLTVSVDVGASAGVIVNAADVTADQHDPDPSDNTSSTVSVGVVEATGTDSLYSFQSGCAGSGPSLSFVDISATGTALGLDDDGEATVSIGFDFPLYGGSYASLRVGNNGGLLFSASGDVVNPNGPLPAFGVPFLAAYWDDIGATTGDVYHQTFASCPVTDGGPGACLVVQWDNRPHYAGIGSATFEAILYQNGSVLFEYDDVEFGDSRFDFGRSATIGIQGADSGQALQYAFDTPGCVVADGAVGCAILFTRRRQKVGGIPAVRGAGLLLLVLLTASAGVLLLRRR